MTASAAIHELAGRCVPATFRSRAKGLSRLPRLLTAVVLAAAFMQMVSGESHAADRTVKVFVLAGQSNMEGKAQNTLFDHQARDEKTREFFAHLRTGDEWTTRDDVFIRFLDRHGRLTLGYGSPGRTGVELEFGHVVGDHFDEPVLLIKTAWGGHSLYQKFRSPSAGLPDAALLDAELQQAQQRVTNNNEKRSRNDPLPTMDEIRQAYGSSYREMLAQVRDTLDNLGTLFPELQEHSPELAGFVWFQGFNDMFGDHAPGSYEQNMTLFIQDVRRDLNAPKLPFVIGALGQNGSQPAQGAMLQIRDAQLAMNNVPEFRGNVIAFRTDVLADKEAERLFPGWQDHFEEWQKVGSDRPYHYLGSAIWFTRIGREMGLSMLKLQTP